MPAASAAAQNRLPGRANPMPRVGGVDRRVQAAHEEPHARADGVRQRAGARDPGLDPERVVVVDRQRVDGEPRAHQHVGQRVHAPAREVPAREVVVGERTAGLARVEHEVHRRPDPRCPVQVGERERQPLVGQVEVARAAQPAPSAPPRNGSASRSACTGQASGASARARATMAWAASSATTGRARYGRCRPAPQPRSTLTDPGGVAAASDRTWSRKRGRRRSRHSPARSSYTATVSRSMSVS